LGTFGRSSFRNGIWTQWLRQRCAESNRSEDVLVPLREAGGKWYWGKGVGLREGRSRRVVDSSQFLFCKYY
jgi:hypothetical protein